MTITGGQKQYSLKCQLQHVTEGIVADLEEGLIPFVTSQGADLHKKDTL